MKDTKGYVLVEILIAVQIIMVIILFIVTVTMFNSKVLIENEQKQSALFILQREIEKIIAQEVANSIELGSSVVYRIHTDTVVEEVHHNLEIIVTWNRVTNNLANIQGQASWQDGKRLRSVTLATNQFIYTPKEGI